MFLNIAIGVEDISVHIEHRLSAFYRAYFQRPGIAGLIQVFHQHYIYRSVTVIAKHFHVFKIFHCKLDGTVLRRFVQQRRLCNAVITALRHRHKILHSTFAIGLSYRAARHTKRLGKPPLRPQHIVWSQ